MHTVEDIRAAIEALSPQQRSELQRLLRDEPSKPKAAAKLPNQAARRRRILGDKVLPNLILESRHSELR